MFAHDLNYLPRLTSRSAAILERSGKIVRQQRFVKFYLLFANAEKNSKNHRNNENLIESNQPTSAFRTQETLPAIKNAQKTIANTVNARYLTSFTNVNRTTTEITRLAMSCDNFQKGPYARTPNMAQIAEILS